MRYAKGHKDETHGHIVKIASKLFREEGIEKIGVAAVMESAGLTVGGFYSHFKSKEELVGEAIACAADQTLFRMFGALDDDGKTSLKLIVERYLSVEHRDNPGMGCVVSALASELKNRPADTRATVADKTAEFIQRIANRLPSKVGAKTRLRTASAIWAVMVGTLQLSRIVPDKELSTQLLKDGIANALRLASETERPNAA
ncbi:TetR/AcrR family transcriptional regulator [Paraburkholderia sp. BCC1885]|jgi:TetR/AcrR family transcriptional repressor of nem operon|uniref:TetR/AcrR family transcriptional regulator n=1 Tax=Paraburkholderia sp. BCC1885 TaxID=2562669 RepID=UPI00118432F5|nr:TetR/AcrR family transcriptional regulator [Paraburkholderia sp. BCC1885]